MTLFLAHLKKKVKRSEASTGTHTCFSVRQQSPDGE